VLWRQRDVWDEAGDDTNTYDYHTARDHNTRYHHTTAALQQKGPGLDDVLHSRRFADPND
jgi:hypothetical protein